MGTVNPIPPKYHRLLADWLNDMRAAIAKHGDVEAQHLYHDIVSGIGTELLKNNFLFKLDVFMAYCGYGTSEHLRTGLKKYLEPVPIPRIYYRTFYRWLNSIHSVVEQHCSEQLKNTYVWWLTRIGNDLSKNNTDFRADVFMRECGYGEWYHEHVVLHRPTVPESSQTPPFSEHYEEPGDNIGNH